ncbi:MAG: choice-of-anchor P family protein [Actinomycetota bacterium]
MSRTRLLRVAAPLLGLLLAAVALTLASSVQSEAATRLKGSFRGNAYATFANAEAGPIATELGRSAFQPCPCRGTGGKVLSNTINSVATSDNGRVLRADVTRSTVFTKRGATSARVRNTSTITGLRALDGLITADAIKAVSNTSATTRSIKGSSTGSEFVNLRIAGKAIKSSVAPNTRINLPGLGYVLLKSVKSGGNGRIIRTTTVDMLTIVVTRNNTFALPVGSRIVVAHAHSGFSRTQPKSQLGGSAYAAQALATTDVLKNRVGRAAFIVVGCEGTGGKVRTNNVNTLDVAGIITAGTGKTTAYGRQFATGGTARTTATVEDLSLLDGLISADVVKAVATDTYRNGKRTSSTSGTRFANLSVAGLPVPVDVEPNTRLNLPGIGYVVINEQKIPAPNSTQRTQVNGLRVVVTQSNALGLPVGLQLVVAHADSTAVRF